MKDQDMRRVFGLTWAGWINCLLLQWLCLRLQREVEDDGTISGWAVCWAPIWRVGWSLPTFRKKRPVFPVPAQPQVIRYVSRGTILMRTASNVRAGQAVVASTDGSTVSAAQVADAPCQVGTAMKSAQLGEVVEISIGTIDEHAFEARLAAMACGRSTTKAILIEAHDALGVDDPDALR